MIRTGTRLYSALEIKDMLDNEMNGEFLMYVKNAPDNIRDIVFSWITDDEKREKLKKELDELVVEVIIEPEEGEEKSENVMLKSDQEERVESTDIQQGETIQNNFEDKKGTVRRLYNALEFKARMEVPVLLVTISDTKCCLVHQSSLEKLQVLLPSFGGTKKYSLMINCCTKCKKFYMTREEFANKEQILKSRFIEYMVEH